MDGGTQLQAIPKLHLTAAMFLQNGNAEEPPVMSPGYAIEKKHNPHPGMYQQAEQVISQLPRAFDNCLEQSSLGYLPLGERLSLRENRPAVRQHLPRYSATVEALINQPPRLPAHFLERGFVL